MLTQRITSRTCQNGGPLFLRITLRAEGEPGDEAKVILLGRRLHICKPNLQPPGMIGRDIFRTVSTLSVPTVGSSRAIPAWMMYQVYIWFSAALSAWQNSRTYAPGHAPYYLTHARDLLLVKFVR